MSDVSGDRLGELLSAYLDDEVDEGERAQVERALREDANARRLLAELRHTTELVSALPRHLAPASLQEDIERQVERSALLGEAQPAAPPRGGMHRTLRVFGGIAAMFGLIMVSGWYLLAKNSREKLADLRRSPAWDAAAPNKPTREDETGARTEDRVAKKGPASTSRNKPSAAREDRDASDRPMNAQTSATAATMPPSGRTVEALVLQNAAAAAVVNNSFAVEELQLTIECADAKEQQEVEARLAAGLNSVGVQPLTRAARSQAAPIATEETFYVQGAATVNFVDPRQRQLLVRAPLSQVSQVLGEAAGGTGRAASAKLDLPGSQAVGLASVNNELQQFAQIRQMKLQNTFQQEEVAPTAKAKPRTLAPTASDDAEGGGFSFFRQMLGLVGLDASTSKELSQRLADAVPAEVDKDLPANTDDRERVAAKSSAELDRSGEAELSPVVDEAADSRYRRGSLVDRLSRELEEKKTSEPARSTEEFAERSQPSPLDASVALADRNDDPIVTLVINLTVSPETSGGAHRTDPPKPSPTKPTTTKPAGMNK